MIYRFQVKVPRAVRLPEVDSESSDALVLEREDFFAWLWAEFGESGLTGIHEGTLLSEEAAQQGLETESWTVDSGEAPRGRDWVGKQDLVDTKLYFASFEAAEEVRAQLARIPGLVTAVEVESLPDQDWDAEWKAHFHEMRDGVRIEPFWWILPPWVEGSADAETRVIRVNPGAGFGTGTHETTQLCLQAIGELSQKQPLFGQQTLDFGSGSGILAIGMAQLGAQVLAVEIDPLAIDNSRDNARLNAVEPKIDYRQELGSFQTQCPVVVANILRPVLLEFAERLVGLLAPGGTLILSGLIESDVESVSQRYAELLSQRRAGQQGASSKANFLPRVLKRNEWRALVFSL